MTMNVEQEQILNNLDIKMAKLEKEHGDEAGAKELIELYQDYQENGTTPEELKLFWEDVNHYCQ
ncbi:hypothetical protein [Staphylococcus argenteus]|uniref:hypothetical protein n=2 Tax=Staphylococcus TaxID=1279 RepID=UPI001559A89B|nr:hypothetical protein [Staphylococcus argenteus]